MTKPDYETYKLGDWELQCGAILRDAHIAYKTFGDPKSPAIVYPTCIKYFIIVPALFGNGQSTSPSNTSYPHPFPKVSFYDNVRAQHALITQHFEISHLHAVLGWSMGAGQTFQWVTQFPNMMDFAVPFCGSAKTSLHNQVFLEGVKSALLAAKGIPSGGVMEGGVKGEGADAKRVWSEEEKMTGLKALGRVYAGWGFSQAFYREKLHETHYGFKDLESFMIGFWEGWACSKDPENMLVMLQTWQSGDCSQQEPFNGNFEKAMASIKAKVLVLPSKTDLYFPPEDSEYEVLNMKPGLGTLAEFPSIWGHWAGGPGDSKADLKWLDDHLSTFLTKGEIS
ncbi:homoserine O-acetyltransferase/O-succinyltransferase, partial [Lecanoromycetidae sp. Uapishka_2]